jgi:hypothetical protein
MHIDLEAFERAVRYGRYTSLFMPISTQKKDYPKFEPKLCHPNLALPSNQFFRGFGAVKPEHGIHAVRSGFAARIKRSSAVGRGSNLCASLCMPRFVEHTSVRTVTSITSISHALAYLSCTRATDTNARSSETLDLNIWIFLMSLT